MAGNINDCLADTNCIGMVENVDTRKVVVGVENEGVLNTSPLYKLLINPFVLDTDVSRL